jgi:hypothetical protein
MRALAQLHQENAQMQGNSHWMVSWTNQHTTHQRRHPAWLEVACYILQQIQRLLLVEGADDGVIEAL